MPEGKVSTSTLYYIGRVGRKRNRKTNAQEIPAWRLASYMLIFDAFLETQFVDLMDELNQSSFFNCYILLSLAFGLLLTPSLKKKVHSLFQALPIMKAFDVVFRMN